jgi:hypothetical protein
MIPLHSVAFNRMQSKEHSVRLRDLVFVSVSSIIALSHSHFLDHRSSSLLAHSRTCGRYDVWLFLQL